MQRPYIQLYADDLLEFAISSTSLDELRAILHELQFRYSRRARHVREVVLARWQELVEESFRWPTTDVPAGTRNGRKKVVFVYQRGLLKHLTYQVGGAGLPTEARRTILDRVLKSKLPMINSVAYIEEWGQPNSSRRLKKLAESLAAFCRNAKRNDPIRRAASISDWENDLAYLKIVYYDGRYDFAWPSTYS